MSVCVCVCVCECIRIDILGTNSVFLNNVWPWGHVKCMSMYWSISYHYIAASALSTHNHIMEEALHCFNYQLSGG